MFSTPATYHPPSSLTSCSARVIRGFLTVLLFFGLDQSVSVAQDQDTTRAQVEQDIEKAIEGFDPEESDMDAEELAEFLQDLVTNPLNINRAGVDELLQIPGLNFRMVQNIVNYRLETAPFQTVEELTNVSGIGTATLTRIRPYITTGSGLERGRDLYLNPDYWTRNSRFELFSRYRRVLNRQEGYKRPFDEGGYAGSPAHYYQRFRYSSNHLSAVLTQDKDPGEPLPEPAEFDFNSWHIALQDNGKLKNLVIGDYSVSFGQGLLLWNGGAFGKGREVTGAISKNERGIRPYTSAQETGAFRGVAATYGERLQFTGFWSSRKRTATKIEENRYRFPGNNGFHRTANEIERKNNLGQETAGGRIRLQVPVGYIGISGYFNRFDKTIGRGTAAYQQYDFSGHDQGAFSADYRLLLGPAVFFSEAVYTDNGGYGMVTGTELEAGEATDIALAYRYYDKSLQAIYGAGFGELSGNPRNEEGFYLGISHVISPTVRAAAYFDQFRFPAARFQNSHPSSGYDWLGLIEFSPNRELDIYGLFRYKNRTDEYTSVDEFGREVGYQGHQVRSSSRFQADYQVHPRVRLRTRFDIVKTKSPAGDNSRGYLLFQDIRYVPHPDLTIDARVTLFETDDFESRVFQFENDLLYVMSNTMLFDQGQRLYLVLNYKAAEWIDFWFKISTTVYENRHTISSGLAEIDGNRRNDIGIQARVRF